MRKSTWPANSLASVVGIAFDDIFVIEQPFRRDRNGLLQTVGIRQVQADVVDGGHGFLKPRQERSAPGGPGLHVLLGGEPAGKSLELRLRKQRFGGQIGRRFGCMRKMEEDRRLDLPDLAQDDLRVAEGMEGRLEQEDAFLRQQPLGLFGKDRPLDAEPGPPIEGVGRSDAEQDPGGAAQPEGEGRSRMPGKERREKQNRRGCRAKDGRKDAGQDAAHVYEKVPDPQFAAGRAEQNRGAGDPSLFQFPQRPVGVAPFFKVGGEHVLDVLFVFGRRVRSAGSGIQSHDFALRSIPISINNPGPGTKTDFR
jgi:hypothetical protein